MVEYAYTAGAWYYYLANDRLGKPDGWYEYDYDNSWEIEELYRDYVRAGTPDQLSKRIVRSPWVEPWVTGQKTCTSGFHYIVNLKTLRQINAYTGISRPIARTTNGKPPSGTPSTDLVTRVDLTTEQIVTAPRASVIFPRTGFSFFTIDQADYEIVQEILRSLGVEDPNSFLVETVVQIHANDHEKRVRRLHTRAGFTMALNGRPLPDSIGHLQKLRQLDLSSSNIEFLPDSIGHLRNLTHLMLNRSRIASLPDSVGRLRNLTHLDLSDTGIVSLPDSIGKMSNLTHLDLSSTRIVSLPDSIGELSNLTHLDLASTRIATLPNIGQLNNLVELNLQSTRIVSWYVSNPMHLNNFYTPEAMDESLLELRVYHTTLEILPDFVGNFRNLQELRILKCGHMKTLPEAIGRLTSLKRLHVRFSALENLPGSIGQLRNLEELDLGGNKHLSRLPAEIVDLTSLKKLWMAGTKELVSLPPSIERLRNLESLRLGGARNLSRLPDDIGTLPNLEEINLSYSGIVSLPESMETMARLKWLMLDDTRLLQLRYGQGNDPEEYLLRLAQGCPLLGFLGKTTEVGWVQLCHALARNRAKSRTDFRVTNTAIEAPTPTIRNPKLWPHILSAATNAFDPYPSDSYKNPYSIPKPDAIFQLLVDGTDPFVGILQSRCSVRGTTNYNK